MSYFIEKQNRCFFKLKLVCMTQRFTFTNCLINDVCIFFIHICLFLYLSYRFIQDHDWSSCSATCGEGIRRRPYRCKIFLEFSKTVATLNDSLCHGIKPPDEVERCFMEPCSMSNTYEDRSYMQ